MDNITDDRITFLKWVKLACITMLALIPVQIILFIIFPPSRDVETILNQFHSNWLIGLIQFDFFYMINNVLLIIIYLYLFDLTFKKFKYGSLIAISLGFVGIASYFSSNPAFEFLTLSQKFFANAPEIRPLLLAAGETLLVGYTGTSYIVYYILDAISLLTFSVFLLKSPNVKKSIGVLGFISAILMSVPSSAGTIGMVFSLTSLIPWTLFILFLVIDIRRSLLKL